jgi:hypothetical protein
LGSFFLILIFVIPNAAIAQSGCTDPKANNYDAGASTNDGSCKYPNTSVTPALETRLPEIVTETSGLLFYNGKIWTHNDSGGQPILYQIDSTSRTLLRQVFISNASAIDWEDITRDNTHLYIGDIGNNEGNRTDLCIYKIPLVELENDTAYAIKISYSYPDQSDFSPRNQNHNFDAEALIALGDSLYIFSKNWQDLRSKCYTLPKDTGTHIAQLSGEFYVGGLITGAEFDPIDSLIFLTAYTKLLAPFVYLLWDFDQQPFSGNKRKVDIPLAFHQFEAVSLSGTSRQFFLSNESLGSVPAKLFRLDISRWLGAIPTGLFRPNINRWMSLFPNPTSDFLTLKWNPSDFQPHAFSVFDMSGRIILNGAIHPGIHLLELPVSTLSPGTYFLQLNDSSGETTLRFLKQ